MKRLASQKVRPSIVGHALSTRGPRSELERQTTRCGDGGGSGRRRVAPSFRHARRNSAELPVVVRDQPYLETDLCNRCPVSPSSLGRPILNCLSGEFAINQQV